MNVIDVTGLKARLIEIDENLVRNELSAIEYADQLAERQEIYEGLYPETRHGNTTERNKVKRNNCVLLPSFTQDTVDKTGKSKRTVQQAIKVSKSIPTHIKQEIKNIPAINKTTELQALAAITAPKDLPKDEQRLMGIIVMP